MLGRQLIPDWHHAGRWASVRLIGAAASLQLVLLAFPQQLQQYLPDRVMHGAAILCLVGAFLGRITTQEAPNDRKPN